MTVSSSLVELLQELLSPLGVIAVRRMFGGAGVYCDGQVFAFIDNDTLFLKTDEAGRAQFEAEGLGPFTYMTKDGPGTLLSYWRAPERLLDEPDDMLAWARRALAVAKKGQDSRSKPARAVAARAVTGGKGNKPPSARTPRKSSDSKTRAPRSRAPGRKSREQ